MFFVHRGHKRAKVSVLTPVFNVARYLPRCLESLRRQRLSDIEFICVNDGSTDESLQILKSYASQDDRFRIIDQKNAGYGAAMNRALDASCGQYIGIVESDDFVSGDMFKCLFRLASRKRLDIVKTNYFEHRGGTEDVFSEPFVDFEYGKVFDPWDVPEIIKVIPNIWAALYSRQMLEDNGIRFNETPGASFQDTSFAHRCWISSHRAMLLHDAFVHYRLDREESSVKSNSKVFAVCDEYATTESFLAEREDRLRRFGPMLNAAKFNTYRWNYNRITSDYHAVFCKRWAAEYRSALADGLLDKDLLTPVEWAQALELMDDPVSFALQNETI